MMALKRRKFEFQEFPNDIMEDILLRLPLKSLFKLKTVCKSWNSLITTYVCTHIHTHRGNQMLLIKSAVSLPDESSDRGVSIGRQLHFFSLHNDNPPFDMKYKHLYNPFLCYNAIIFPHDKIDLGQEDVGVDVIGTHNGLVCLVAQSDFTAMVWNPCIGKYVILPRLPPYRIRPEISFVTHGFGYDSLTNDYKVVRIMRYRTTSRRMRRGNINAAEKMSYEIWSLAQPSSWKSVAAPPEHDDHHFLNFQSPVYVSGVLYWVNHSCQDDHTLEVDSIVSFDMSSELLGMIKFPQVFEKKSNFFLAEYKDYLALFLEGGRQDIIEMWVMEDKSWTKLFSMKLMPEACWIGLRPIGMRNNGELVIYIGHITLEEVIHGFKKISVNIDTKSLSDFKITGPYKFMECLFVMPFVESLVLLDQHCALSTFQLQAQVGNLDLN